MADYERELDWEESVEESSEYFDGADGDYDFTVVSAEKGYVVKGKYSGQKMITVTLNLKGTNASGIITDRITLNTAFMWKISQFFASIGDAPQADGKYKMHWNDLVGKTGRLKTKTVEEAGKNYKNVDKYYKKAVKNSAW